MRLQPESICNLTVTWTKLLLWPPPKIFIDCSPESALFKLKKSFQKWENNHSTEIVFQKIQRLHFFWILEETESGVVYFQFYALLVPWGLGGLGFQPIITLGREKAAFLAAQQGHLRNINLVSYNLFPFLFTPIAKSPIHPSQISTIKSFPSSSTPPLRSLCCAWKVSRLGSCCDWFGVYDDVCSIFMIVRYFMSFFLVREALL